MQTNNPTSNKKNAEPKSATYLDGRKQVIDLLRYLPQDEKNKLLKNLKIKNPEVANSLIEEGISYGQVEGLSDERIQILMKYITPQLFGMALKNSSRKLIQRVLTLAERDYAEISYDILISFVDDAPKKSKMAQDKIINTAIRLFGKNQFLEL